MIFSNIAFPYILHSGFNMVTFWWVFLKIVVVILGHSSGFSSLVVVQFSPTRFALLLYWVVNKFRNSRNESRSLECASYDDSEALHISTFVVACSLVWFCMIKSEESKVKNCVAQDSDDDELCYLVFLADCRDSTPELSFPSRYFGNCGNDQEEWGRERKWDRWGGKIKAVERRVRDFKSDALTKTETLMSEYRVMETR